MNTSRRGWAPASSKHCLSCKSQTHVDAITKQSKYKSKVLAEIHMAILTTKHNYNQWQNNLHSACFRDPFGGRHGHASG